MPWHIKIRLDARYWYNSCKVLFQASPYLRRRLAARTGPGAAGLCSLRLKAGVARVRARLPLGRKISFVFFKFLICRCISVFFFFGVIPVPLSAVAAAGWLSALLRRADIGEAYRVRRMASNIHSASLCWIRFRRWLGVLYRHAITGGVFNVTFCTFPATIIFLIGGCDEGPTFAALACTAGQIVTICYAGGVLISQFPPLPPGRCIDHRLPQFLFLSFVEIRSPIFKQKLHVIK